MGGHPWHVLQGMEADELYAPGHSVKPAAMKGSKGSALLAEFEPSTAAGSELPSKVTSRAPSDADHEELGDNSKARENPAAAERTSVMMRNLPNNFTRQMLLELLETEGFTGCFDFVYLPIDFHSGSGLGYAFLNLATPDAAEAFRAHFTGFNKWRMASDKICQVTWSDSIQGLQAHIDRYRNSPVMHESVPEDHRPLLFSGLEQVVFPAPTKKIRAPRRWHRRH